MSKYLHIGLVLFSILLTCFFFLVALTCCSVYLTWPVCLAVLLGWIAFSFSAAYFSAGILLFFQFNTRRPVLAEQQRLERCLREVLQRAGEDRRFDLLVEENLQCNAFAIGRNTIVLTKGVMRQLTDDELKGILAHELGHLNSKDPIIGSAFSMALLLPKITRWVYSMAIRKAEKISGALLFWVCRRRFRAKLLLLLVAGYFLYRLHLLLPAIVFFLLLKLCKGLERVCHFLWLPLSRFSEYRQDAYAHRLGYGAELSQALFKLTMEEAQPVNRYFIMRNSTHPVIHNRIRRLERLEGLNGMGRLSGQPRGK